MTETVLRVGDGGRDGHGIVEDIRILHNLADSNALTTAYAKGTAIVGMDLTNFCSHGDDSKVPSAFVHHLQDLGVLPHDLDDQQAVYPDENDCFVEGPSGFADLYLRIAKLGDKTLDAKVMPANDHIDIGGYGLFA